MSMKKENQKLKEWCYNELKVIRKMCKKREEMKIHCAFCLGAVQYAQTIGLVTYEEVKTWWDSLRDEFWYGEFGS